MNEYWFGFQHGFISCIFFSFFIWVALDYFKVRLRLSSDDSEKFVNKRRKKDVNKKDSV